MAITPLSLQMSWNRLGIGMFLCRPAEYRTLMYSLCIQN